MTKAITPIRYPGGKSKMVKKILSPLFPEYSGDFYDPFLGGGSIPLWIAQDFPDKKIRVNDLNPALYTFWTVLKDQSFEMIEELINIRQANDPKNVGIGRELLKEHQEKLYEETISDFSRACSYYVLNKISFSGLTEHGSISASAYEKTFNPLNIRKLAFIAGNMKNFEIDNMDYETHINGCSANDFVFLDPPYDLGEKKSTLYGKKGEMHSGFDHERFAEVVYKLPAKFMITYNDTEEIRERFKDYKIMDQEYTYFMAFKQDEAGNKTTRKKNELIIVNY
jgi:DNA adenine methylase